MTGVSCLRSGEDIEVVAKGLRRISFGAEINQAASAIFSHIVDRGEGVLVGATERLDAEVVDASDNRVVHETRGDIEEDL